MDEIRERRKRATEEMYLMGKRDTGWEMEKSLEEW